MCVCQKLKNIWNTLNNTVFRNILFKYTCIKQNMKKNYRYANSIQMKTTDTLVKLEKNNYMYYEENYYRFSAWCANCKGKILEYTQSVVN